jgi:hypothetical protein
MESFPIKFLIVVIHIFLNIDWDPFLHKMTSNDDITEYFNERDGIKEVLFALFYVVVPLILMFNCVCLVFRACMHDLSFGVLLAHTPVEE